MKPMSACVYAFLELSAKFKDITLIMFCLKKFINTLQLHHIE